MADDDDDFVEALKKISKDSHQVALMGHRFGEHLIQLVDDLHKAGVEVADLPPEIVDKFFVKIEKVEEALQLFKNEYPQNNPMKRHLKLV